MAQHKQIFELAPGIFVMLPTKREDLPAKITVHDPPSGIREPSQRNPILCPKSHLNAVCGRLRAGDKRALTAVTCHAFGNEMPKRCGDCKDGPFGSCVVYRNKSNNACSNCIFARRERLCEWRTRYKLD